MVFLAPGAELTAIGVPLLGDLGLRDTNQMIKRHCIVEGRQGVNQLPTIEKTLFA
jgi:hypothetical protein